MIKKIIKNLFLFAVFSLLYGTIETAWKGEITHWSMFVLGGLVGVLIGSINEIFPWELSFWYQCLIGTSVATLLEGISGIILNVWFKLGIWDYSHMPLSFFFGQCCLPFCVAWFVLSGICIQFDDYIRWCYFDEEYPTYNFSLRLK